MEQRPLALLTDGEGQPLKLELGMRQSTSAPGRLKVAFVADTDNGLRVRKPDGELAEGVDLPEQATKVAIASEFRLEMN